MIRRSKRKRVSSSTEHLPKVDDVPSTRKKSNVKAGVRPSDDEHGDSEAPSSTKAKQAVEVLKLKSKQQQKSPKTTPKQNIPSEPTEIIRRSGRVSNSNKPWSKYADFDLPSTSKKSNVKAGLRQSDEHEDYEASTPTSANKADLETPKSKQQQRIETPKSKRLQQTDTPKSKGQQQMETPKSRRQQQIETPKSTSKQNVPSQPATITRRSTRVSNQQLPTNNDSPSTSKKSKVKAGVSHSDEDEDFESPTLAKSNQAVKLRKSKQQQKSESPRSTPKKKPSIMSCPLPCREDQFQDIWSFLRNNLTQKDSSCMYIAGVPGTGKTLITRSVVKSLHESGFDFTDIYINGLSLSSPNRIYKRFYQALTPEQGKVKLTPDKACVKLQLYFEKYHKPIVLIIDELDQVLDKNQVILYRLLEWTSSPSSQFSLICIFNTMNLPENVMTMRNNSRMGMARCTFPPYTRDQLGTIVQKYLGPEKTAKIGEAVSLLSAKVASISGDARRAIDISKRTVELVETKGISGVVAVSEAFKELFTAPRIKALRNCSRLEKLILQAIITDLHMTGMEETSVNTIANNVYSQTLMEGWSINSNSIMAALGLLAQSRMIAMESNSSSIHNKVRLNVPIVDVQFAFGKIEE